MPRGPPTKSPTVNTEPPTDRPKACLAGSLAGSLAERLADQTDRQSNQWIKTGRPTSTARLPAHSPHPTDRPYLELGHSLDEQHTRGAAVACAVFEKQVEAQVVGANGRNFAHGPRPVVVEPRLQRSGGGVIHNLPWPGLGVVHGIEIPGAGRAQAAGGAVSV